MKSTSFSNQLSVPCNILVFFYATSSCHVLCPCHISFRLFCKFEAVKWRMWEQWSFRRWFLDLPLTTRIFYFLCSFDSSNFTYHTGLMFKTISSDRSIKRKCLHAEQKSHSESNHTSNIIVQKQKNTFLHIAEKQAHFPYSHFT